MEISCVTNDEPLQNAKKIPVSMNFFLCDIYLFPHFFRGGGGAVGMYHSPYQMLKNTHVHAFFFFFFFFLVKYLPLVVEVCVLSMTLNNGRKKRVFGGHSKQRVKTKMFLSPTQP